MSVKAYILNKKNTEMHLLQLTVVTYALAIHCLWPHITHDIFYGIIDSINATWEMPLIDIVHGGGAAVDLKWNNKIKVTGKENTETGWIPIHLYFEMQA